MGTIASGIIRKGEEIVVLPSMKRTKVKSIITYDGELGEACAPMAVTITLEDEIDVSRGYMLAKPKNMPDIESYIDANLVWMAEKPLKIGDEFLVKHCHSTTRAVIEKIQYVFNPADLSRREQDNIELNQIARVRIRTHRDLIFDEYKSNKSTGKFIVIDLRDNNTSGAGMILKKIKTTEPKIKTKIVKSRNISKVEGKISKEDREKAYGHKSATLWFVGLSGSGKSTIAFELEKQLFANGCVTCVYDGDNMRFGLNRDLGFSAKDRQENIRRVAEVAKLFNTAGGIAITSFITPFEESRQLAREIIGQDYIEIYLDVPVEVCARRDPKGLYKKVYDGEIENFTGITAPFEIPKNPEIRIDTDKCTVNDAVNMILEYLTQRGIV